MYRPFIQLWTDVFSHDKVGHWFSCMQYCKYVKRAICKVLITITIITIASPNCDPHKAIYVTNRSFYRVTKTMEPLHRIVASPVQ